MNSLVAGTDVGDMESLTTVLSPIEDVTDQFTFPMTEEGYAYFANRVPKEARIAFASTIMASSSCFNRVLAMMETPTCKSI